MCAFSLTIGFRMVCGRASDAKTTKARKVRPKGVVEAFVRVGSNLAGDAMIANNLFIQMAGSDFKIFTKRSGGRCMHHSGAAVSESDNTGITTSSGNGHTVDGNRFPFMCGHRQRMQKANASMAISFDALTSITSADMAFDGLHGVGDEKFATKDISGFVGTPMSSLDGGMVGGDDSRDAVCGHTNLQTTPKLALNSDIFRETIR